MKMSYGVANLRSLRKMAPIELRPITVLVGRNSAGKSTYLRSFSLLRQSLEVRSSAPILWYGDYVDFGDFGAAVTDGKKDREITFEFQLDDFETRDFDEESSYYDDSIYYQRRQKITYKTANLRISLGEQLGRTVRRSIQFELPADSISLEARFEKNGALCSELSINHHNLSELISGYSVYFSASNIFGKPNFVQIQRRNNQSSERLLRRRPVIRKAIASILRKHVDKRISDKNLELETLHILRYPELNNSALSTLNMSTEYRSLQKLYNSWQRKENSETLDKVSGLCALNYALIAIGRIGPLLSGIFASTTYLGPARARSERYYRSQELEVSEISPDGRNLPMFLASLKPTEQKKFSDWVENLFGFGLAVERKEGHVTIQLHQRRQVSVNLADTGYGISQILPVLAQIWWATHFSNSRNRPISPTLRPITMEQPELHLHPAHQAKLAEAFVSAINTKQYSRGQPILVIETHSESLINHLGELVERGDIASDDIQIAIFSAHEQGDKLDSVISTSEFDSEGALIDWPYGFFNY